MPRIARYSFDTLKNHGVAFQVAEAIFEDGVREVVSRHSKL